MTDYPIDLIIVGAGVAGLTAAAELSGAGFNIQILEARDRLGGRLHTIHDPLSAIPIELGAEFIHGHSEHTWELVQDIPLLVGEVQGESLFSDNGELAPRDSFWNAWGEIVQRMEQMTEDDLPYDEFVARYAGDLEEADRLSARSFVAGFNASDPARVSTRWLLAGEKKAEEVGDGNFRPFSGYDRLVEALRTRAFPAAFSRNTVVQQIAWETGQVRVQARTALGRPLPELTARAALITVPVSLLRQNLPAFSPALPEKKKAAEDIEMGPVVRIVFRFRERFWQDEHPELSFLLSKDPVMPTWWTSLPAITPILTGWAAGPAAEALRGKPAAEVADAALDALARITGHERSWLEERVDTWHTHDWDHDPFAQGAYSWVPSGKEAATIALAASVVDTLFFAGEATNTENQSATVHGAIATGKRAAREILSALNRV